MSSMEMSLLGLHNPHYRSEGIVKLSNHALPANSFHTLRNKTLCELQSPSSNLVEFMPSFSCVCSAELIPPFFLLLLFMASSPLTHCFPSGKPHSVFKAGLPSFHNAEVL